MDSRHLPGTKLNEMALVLQMRKKCGARGLGATETPASAATSASAASIAAMTAVSGTGGQVSRRARNARSSANVTHDINKVALTRADSLHRQGRLHTAGEGTAPPLDAAVVSSSGALSVW
eukprot:scaffold1916_cov123-Isochrysis_galbana.AAC.12